VYKVWGIHSGEDSCCLHVGMTQCSLVGALIFLQNGSTHHNAWGHYPDSRNMSTA
jgi:hypothetical protein